MHAVVLALFTTSFASSRAIILSSIIHGALLAPSNHADGYTATEKQSAKKRKSEIYYTPWKTGFSVLHKFIRPNVCASPRVFFFHSQLRFGLNKYWRERTARGTVIVRVGLSPEYSRPGLNIPLSPLMSVNDSWLVSISVPREIKSSREYYFGSIRGAIPATKATPTRRNIPIAGANGPAANVYMKWQRGYMASL